MARPTRQQRRIREAKQLQNNATLHEIFTQTKSEIIERWLGSETTEQRERCYYDARALIELRDSIDTAATDTD